VQYTTPFFHRPTTAQKIDVGHLDGEVGDRNSEVWYRDIGASEQGRVVMNSLRRSEVIGGICLSYLFGVAGVLWSWIAVAFIAALLLGVLGWKKPPFRRLPLRVIILFVCALIVGISHAGWKTSSMPENDVRRYFGQSAQWEGVVQEEPDLRSTHQKVTVRQLKQDGQPRSGGALLNLPVFPRIRVGDHLEWQGPVEPVPIIETFRYDRYLARRDIYGIVLFPHVSVVRHEENWRAKLFSWKAKMIMRIQTILEEPHDSFLAGLLFGAKHSMPEFVLSAFRKTGTSHVLALSGFNITILIVWVMTVVVRCGGRRPHAIGIATLLVLWFVFVTGMSASVVRAGVMGLLAAWAGLADRMAFSWLILLEAITVMVIGQPLILRDDAGFQLSVAATTGLMFLSISVERWSLWIPDRFGLRASFVATVSASLPTLPLSWFLFGQISLMSLPMNLMILPLIPLAMIAGAVLLAVATWVPSLAMLAVVPVWIILDFILTMILWASSLPFATISA
jgi:competence protein ComEC